jgi:hypothetical protein
MLDSRTIYSKIRNYSPPGLKPRWIKGKQS